MSLAKYLLTNGNIYRLHKGEEFAFLLETLLEDHGNVIEDLSNGFREAHKVCGL